MKDMRRLFLMLIALLGMLAREDATRRMRLTQTRSRGPHHRGRSPTSGADIWLLDTKAVKAFFPSLHI